MRAKSRAGYTLIELLVATLIIGIMSAFAVPQYLRSVETTKFDDAVGMVQQIGTTNRMFALDHNGNYVNSPFTSSTCGCGTGFCDAMVAAGAGPPPPPPPAYGDACVLICCNYLPDQDYSAGVKPYSYYACDPASANVNCPAGAVSAAARAGGASPYSSWGVSMDTSGKITAFATSTNPPPPSY